MIIQIRGTSGSGKTTAMYKFMELIGGWTPHYRDECQLTFRKLKKRRIPLYYTNDDLDIAIIGGYTSPSGGCDSIKAVSDIYLIVMWLAKKYNVVLEGLMVSEDVTWSSKMPDLNVLYINTTVENCLRRVEQRRAVKGNTRSLDTKFKAKSKLTPGARIAKRYKTIVNTRPRLEAAGAKCRTVSGNQVPTVIKGLLGL